MIKQKNNSIETTLQSNYYIKSKSECVNTYRSNNYQNLLKISTLTLLSYK